jgi:hypothetical protein
MSIKSQIHSSRDFLMAGMRAAARGPMPNAQAEKLLVACLDLVEQLARQPQMVTVTDVETTLGVLHQAAAEMDDETAATSAVVASIRNAIGRLQTLRTEITVK